VYGIVKQSAGFVWVYSEPGKGTSFRIYLPLAEHADRQVTASAPDEVRGGTEPILLVEDSPAVRATARQILERYGYRVLEAASSAAALRLASQPQVAIELLLTDVVMPEMSGRRLAEEFARERPGVKVLYMSGYTDDAVVRHGVLQPGIAYLQKPFSPETLARKVRQVLDGA
jgi:CheY-like chemotaxis protein